MIFHWENFLGIKCLCFSKADHYSDFGIQSLQQIAWTMCIWKIIKNPWTNRLHNSFHQLFLASEKFRDSKELQNETFIAPWMFWMKKMNNQDDIIWSHVFEQLSYFTEKIKDVLCLLKPGTMKVTRTGTSNL
jgi:hypothetical protein